MPFLTQLKVKELSDTANEGRGEWQLTAPLVYEAKDGKLYTVRRGFKTDFASVPRVPIAFLLVGGSDSAPAALHDFLYTAPHKTTRQEADAIFKEAAISEGTPGWRAWILWAGVRLFGASHFC